MRDAARACLSAYPKDKRRGDGRRRPTQAKGSVQEVFVNAERMAADLESDVLWLTEGTKTADRIPPRLCVAPLQVWGPMRDKLLTDKTVVFTSATLMLGGDFSAVATSVGPQAVRAGARRARPPATPTDADEALPWRGLDVGVAVRLRPAGDPLRRPPPAASRAATGSAKAQLDEIVELVDAADGRTLGLFSSRRAAETAAEAGPRAAART